MKKIKTMTSLALSLGMMATMMPVAANATSADGYVVEQPVIIGGEFSEPANIEDVWTGTFEIFIADGVKPEEVLAAIGAEGTDYTLNEDGTMFTCELTEEQASNSKSCELVKNIQMGPAGNYEVPDDTLVYPADEVTRPVIIDYSEPTESTEEYVNKVLIEIFMADGVKPEEVLEAIGAVGTDYTLSDDGTMFTCELTEEQASNAKSCELVKDSKRGPAGNYEVPDDTVFSPADEEDAVNKVNVEIYMVDGAKPEEVLSAIGAEGTDYTLSDDGTMFTCELTEEQASNAKSCELVKDIKRGPAGNYEVPDDTVVSPADEVTRPVITNPDIIEGNEEDVNKVLCEIFMADGVKPEEVLEAIGAVGTGFQLNEDGAMFTCELTEEQASNAKSCELVKDIKRGPADNYDVPDDTVVTPADDDAVNKVNVEIYMVDGAKPEEILTAIGAVGTGFQLNEDSTMFTCEITEEQASNAKSCELVKDIKNVPAGNYEVPDDTVVTPANPEDELPQTGYSNIYKVLVGIASAMTVTGTAMIARSKKKDEE